MEFSFLCFNLLVYLSLALPCNCGKDYQPVCTSNGRVLPNPCVAQCSGFSINSFAMGNCAAVNPCGDNPCPAGSKCVPFHKVCLSVSGECPQYSCRESLPMLLYPCLKYVYIMNYSSILNLKKILV